MGNNKSTYEIISDKLGVSQETKEAVKDLFNRGKEILDKVEEITDQIGDIADNLGKISPAISTVKELMTLTGFLTPKESEFDILYRRIEQALQPIIQKLDETIKKIEQETGNLGQQITLLAVAEKKGEAEYVVVAVRAYLNYRSDNNGNPPPKNHDLTEDRKNQVSESGKVMSILIQHQYWRRVFDETAICSLGWEQHTYRPPTEDGDRFVWDYRLTLAAFLYALNARLLILKTGELKDFKYYIDEIKSYMDHLLYVYRKIYDGIVEIPAPPIQQVIVGFGTSKDVVIYLTGESKTFFEWQNAYRSPCGVVDVYSGVALSEFLPFSQPKTIELFTTSLDFSEKQNLQNLVASREQVNSYSEVRLKNNAYIEWFYPMFAVRTERARQNLYHSLGLLDLWNMILRLNSLIAKYRPESATYFPINPPELGFSLRRASAVRYPIETLSVKGEVIEKRVDTGGNQSISLRSLGSKLGQEYANTSFLSIFSSQISLRRILAGD